MKLARVMIMDVFLKENNPDIDIIKYEDFELHADHMITNNELIEKIEELITIYIVNCEKEKNQ